MPNSNCEALAIREANWMNQDNIIVESDSQVAISSIMDKIVISKQTSNLIEDIRSITWKIKNIRLCYYNRTVNTLTIE